MTQFKMDIGLEVHIRLNTNSKLFSSSANLFGDLPNIHANAIDLGMPGTLPLINREAVTLAIKLGLALKAHINASSYFYRKHYFYPDSSKGYQITQHGQTILTGGYLLIKGDGSDKKIRISHCHIEEDAGKLIHNDLYSQVDYNRAGVPLIELVTFPDFSSAKEVSEFLHSLKSLVQRLDISTGNMEEGAFKADVNISVRDIKSGILGTKCELKNLNSLRLISQAINYEYERQTALLKQGLAIFQETRQYNASKASTISIRSKENAYDYRYIIDPDIPPMFITREDIAQIESTLPPYFLNDTEDIAFKNLKEKQIDFLIQHPNINEYYKIVASQLDNVTAYNWVCVELLNIFQKISIPFSNHIISPQVLIDVVNYVKEDVISVKSARAILEICPYSNKTIKDLINTMNLAQDNNSIKIEEICMQIIYKNLEAVKTYKRGKSKVLGFLVGEVLKFCEKDKYNINAKLAFKIMKECIDKYE